MTNAIDQSWGYLNPSIARQRGIKVVAMYLSLDPSKNATAAHVSAYHAQGIGWLPNWEGDAGAPLLGSGQAKKDAANAVKQFDAIKHGLGYGPKNTVAVEFSCDRQIVGSIPAKVLDYYHATRAVMYAASMGNGAYGEYDLIEQLSKLGLLDSAWQTLAWSGGKISTYADFYQSQINVTLGGSSVDLDRILDAAKLGVWWPPGHPLDTPAEGDGMELNDPVTAADGTKSTVGGFISAAERHAMAAQANAAAALGAANAAKTGVATLLTRQASQTADIAALAKQVAALSALVEKAAGGVVNIDPIPLTGTLQIGGKS